MDTMADDADGVDVPVGLIAPPSLPPVSSLSPPLFGKEPKKGTTPNHQF